MDRFLVRLLAQAKNAVSTTMEIDDMKEHKQLTVLPSKYYHSKPTRYEIVLPPGVDGTSAKWLAVAAIISAALSRIGIKPVLKYLAILMLSTAVLTAILTASLLM